MRFYIAHFFVLRNSLLAVGVAKRSSLRISGVKFTWNAPWLVRKTDSEPCTSSAVSPTPEPKITDIEYLINLVEEVECK